MHILTMHICWLYNLLYLPFSLGALMEDPGGLPLVQPVFALQFCWNTI